MLIMYVVLIIIMLVAPMLATLLYVLTHIMMASHKWDALKIEQPNLRVIDSVVLFKRNLKVVVAYWKVKTPCHAHGECIN